jgi:hypothetical protein
LNIGQGALHFINAPYKICDRTETTQNRFKMRIAGAKLTVRHFLN